MMKEVRWRRALLNGFIVCIIGAAMYMLPSWGHGFRRGFELGPTAADPSAVNVQIYEEISALWRGDWLWLAVLIDVITGLLILWRARAVAMNSGPSRWINGLVVGAVPVALWLPFTFFGGAELMDVVSFLIYLGAGVAGGLLARE